MSSRKKFGLIFLFLIFNTILVIGYLVIRDATLLNELRNETSELAKLDITKDRYNTSIKTKGKYAIVENAIKTYMDDYATSLQSSLDIVKDSKLTKILSYDNYATDGPEFKDSLAYLSEIKTKFNDEIDKLIVNSEEETINSYIEDKISDKYYQELYIEMMSRDDIKSQFNDTKLLLDDTKIRVNNVFDVSIEVLNFLVSNKDSWKLENGEIKFLNQDLYNQYVTLISKIKS